MAENNYTSKAIVRTITATSRTSCKIQDTFYTIEYSEERMLPDLEDVDVELERKLLWNTVNDEVDNQITDIYDAIHAREEEIRKKIRK